MSTSLGPDSLAIKDLHQPPTTSIPRPSYPRPASAPDQFPVVSDAAILRIEAEVVWDTPTAVGHGQPDAASRAPSLRKVVRRHEGSD